VQGWGAEESAAEAPAQAPKRPERSSGAARRAEKLSAEKAAAAALAPHARLELGTDNAQEAAKVLKAALPELRAWVQEGAERMEVLAASLLTYEDRCEELPKWARLLQELMEEQSVPNSLDEDDDLEKVALKGTTALAKANVLKAKPRTCEVGDPVLAFLPEDQEWHPAVVDSILDSGRLKLIFIEYGKPQEVAPDEVRVMEDVADEGEEGEGECEMCQRDLKLTFHHLIPKDKHPTFLGKRLPNGVEGEPTRWFLNKYGVMICRQCHNTVHSIASNEVLALQYNSLQKLLAHPVIQRWLEFAKKRRASSGKSK